MHYESKRSHGAMLVVTAHATVVEHTLVVAPH